GLVAVLAAEGRRGTVVTHGFHAPEELAQLGKASSFSRDGDDEPAERQAGAAPDRGREAAGQGTAAALQERLAQISAELAELRATMAQLEKRLAAGDEERTRQARQLQQVREGLGLTE